VNNLTLPKFFLFLKLLNPFFSNKKLFLIPLTIIVPVSRLLSQEYFQQEVNYKIHVALNDKRHELNAFETVEYINNSSDTLQFLFFHLWPNGYSTNNTALARQLLNSKGKEKLFNDPELEGHIDSLDFKIDGNKVRWSLLPGQPDICRLMLYEYLMPGDTILITTPFHVKVPKGVTSRLGHIGESYQISQWYPKPAVYDKNGWHQMPYLDQGEFYSEFGSFDVRITLPVNYTVGATGDLHNDQEAERLDKLSSDTTWKITAGYLRDDFPPSSAMMKTLQYKGNKIHDFAWFADKRFHVVKGIVKLPDSGREVTTWVMFTNQQADLWKNAIRYLNNSIRYFSLLVGDYPYNTFTAVQSALNAGSGMEYPGITVIGLADDAYTLDEVIAHEVCHSWFYSSLGSDERRYPFMDEGITSAYEARYMHESYPTKKLWELYFKNRKLVRFLHIDKMPVQRVEELELLTQARQNLEQPVNITAQDYSTLNYSTIVYSKAAIGFNYLRAYLGDSLFDSTMHEYFRRWNSKHPQPEDLRRIFESQSGKDLSWFFTDFIGTTKHVDYKVVNLNNQRLMVKNNGELASPLVVSGLKGDSIYFEKWADGFNGEKEIDIPGGDYSEIKIDPMHVMPELYRLNNNIRESGVFRKADPIRLQLLYTIEDPDRRYIIYVPSVNWTKENRLMVGITLNNGSVLPKRVEYFLMPFLTFKDPGLAGFGRITFNITPYEKFIRMAKINFEGTQFGAPGNQNYRIAKAGFDLYFRIKKLNDPVSHKIYGSFITSSDLLQIDLSDKAGMSSYLQFGYMLERKRLINPFSLLAAFEAGKSYQKTSVELNYRYSYYGKKNGLDIRLFAGTILKNSTIAPFYALAPGGRSGREQYLYQGTYPDRFTVFPATFLSRQMTISEGGLVSPVNDTIGYKNWLISVSFTSSLPGKAGQIPVKPFINLLVNDHGNGIGHNTPFFWEAGLKAGIWNVFEIYVPLLVSDNIASITGSVRNRIRFIFNVETFFRVNPKTGIAN
jgi:hypothetical protein